MKYLVRVGVGLATLATLAACQTVPYQGQARNVKLKPKVEGTLALPINTRQEDRDVAEVTMKRNCAPGNYEVLEEGEAVVGQETKSSGSTTNREKTSTKVGSLWGIPITSGDEGGTNNQTHQVTTQVKEWQISYKCVGLNDDNKSRKSSSIQ